jgi:putative membrane protein
VATSGVNTANIIFTLVVLYAIGRTRSGVVIAIEKIVENFGMVELVVLLGVILGAGGIAMLLHVWIGTFFTKQIGKSKEGFYNKINILILLIILGSVFWLTGFIGLLILFLCTVIGLIAPMSKVKRSQCMGFFIIPVMLYYGGVGVWLMTLLQI